MLTIELSQPLSNISCSTARALGLPKGSIGSRYVQLYTAFLLSTLIHVSGGLHAARQDLGEMQYYLSQAIAITFEDAAIAVAQKFGYRGGRAARVAGYLWVIGWCTWSLRVQVHGHIQAGMWDPKMVPFSIVERGLGWFVRV